jgi:hypothetical protein
MGMEGLVKEGSETMGEDYSEAVMDSAIIGAAQRVEHYEMAGYGTVRALAELLGENDHVSLLEQTLEEEKEADEKLTELAQEIAPHALEGNESAEDQEGRLASIQDKGRALKPFPSLVFLGLPIRTNPKATEFTVWHLP